MSFHLHFDPVGGLAGDMLLGALVELVGSGDLLQSLPSRLGLSGVRVTAERVKRHQIDAVSIAVHVEPHTHHRSLADVLRLLEGADLPAVVQDGARRVFERLARAEARIHGCAIEQVHFHEVGADDALVDITGFCLLAHTLEVAAYSAGPFPVARGLTHAAHGGVPLPAPAVLELARDWPLIWLDVEGERVTPTGAALITTLAQSGNPPAGYVRATGYGAGHEDFADRPNLVRALLVEPWPAQQVARDEVIELVACVDDATGEELGRAAEILLGAGALDVYYAALVMKKGRPGWQLTVLSEPAGADRLAALMLQHSGSAGLRRRHTTRDLLRRGWLEVETKHGNVRIKEFELPDGGRRPVPEFEDCRELAERSRVSLREVEQAALRPIGARGPHHE